MLFAQLKQSVTNVHTDKLRHLLQMQRPICASRNNDNINRKLLYNILLNRENKNKKHTIRKHLIDSYEKSNHKKVVL
jgi:hypothetical protein